MAISKHARVSILRRKDGTEVKRSFSDAFSSVKTKWDSFTSKPVVQKAASKAKTFGTFVVLKSREFGSDFMVGYRAFRAARSDRKEQKDLDDVIERLRQKGYDVVRREAEADRPTEQEKAPVAQRTETKPEVKSGLKSDVEGGDTPQEASDEALDAVVEQTDYDRMTADQHFPVEPFVPEGEEEHVIVTPEIDKILDDAGYAEYYPPEVQPPILGDMDAPPEQKDIDPYVANGVKGVDVEPDEDFDDRDIPPDDYDGEKPAISEAPQEDGLTVADMTDMGYSLSGIKATLDESSRKGIMDSIIQLRAYLDEFLKKDIRDRNYDDLVSTVAAGAQFMSGLAKTGRVKSEERELPDVPVPSDAGEEDVPDIPD